MPSHRFYIIREDGAVHWTDNADHAEIFSNDGTAIVIDTRKNQTMQDGVRHEIEDAVPEEEEEEEGDDE